MIYANAKTAKICNVFLDKDDAEFEEKMRFILSKAYIFDYKKMEAKLC